LDGAHADQSADRVSHRTLAECREQAQALDCRPAAPSVVGMIGERDQHRLGAGVRHAEGEGP
jgi:hypothetical protein